MNATEPRDTSAVPIDGQDRSRSLAGGHGSRAVTPMDTPEPQELTDAPGERLDIEYKAWLDLTDHAAEAGWRSDRKEAAFRLLQPAGRSRRLRCSSLLLIACAAALFRSRMHRRIYT